MRLPFQQQQHSKSDPPAVPMQVFNGLVTYPSDNNRREWSSDANFAPQQFRRYIMTGLQDVQLISGVPRKLYTGLLVNPIWFHVNSSVPEASGWVDVYQTPRNPGAASYPPAGSGAAPAGYHFRALDPLSWAALFKAGPGSQPSNPGGPGKIAGAQISNPMTG
jgi:hypothetical protein